MLLFVNLLFRMILCKQGLNIVVMSHFVDTDYWLCPTLLIEPGYNDKRHQVCLEEFKGTIT